MKDDRIDELFSELEQICDQYREQVPGRRRAWPKAVKERIAELQSLGTTGRQIAAKLPIPYMTIISWNKRRQSSSFIPVKVVRGRKKVATVTDATLQSKPKPVQSAPQITTVTVVTPNGVRIEGLPAEMALQFLNGGAL